MNFFVADFLNISIHLLIAVLVVVSLLLLAVVLMQRPKQEGLGAAFGAAITDQAFGARTTDVLKKATVYFGSAFMILCLVLGSLLNKQHAQEHKSLDTGNVNEQSVQSNESAEPAKTAEELEEESLRQRAAVAEQQTAQEQQVQQTEPEMDAPVQPVEPQVTPSVTPESIPAQ